MSKYRIVLMRPTDEACGGDPEKWDGPPGPSEKYATYPTAILVTTYDPKNFRKLKYKKRSFFRQLRVASNEYCVKQQMDTGVYESHKAAAEDAYHWADNEGHYAQVGRGHREWIIVGGD